ncbi:hypothetical protein [Tersicoccus sp. Bi-70]|uniref:hypothetical protein n=1 Tax=Tersicoccus sp. Bi-70 TaxID=1897634 RepID=UPI0011811C19|nr:hypothetical protein [Tersicoccus sp. Bi-70]
MTTVLTRPHRARRRHLRAASRPRWFAVDRPSGQTLRMLLAGCVIAVLGIRLNLMAGVTLGFAAAIAATPWWLPALRRYRYALLVAVLTVLAVCTGLWFTGWSNLERQTDTSLTIATTMLMVGIAASVGAVLWARTYFSPGAIAVLYSIGMTVNIFVNHSLSSSNPWKFALAIPVTVLSLGLCEVFRTRIGTIVVTAVLATVSALNDSRSLFSILVLVLLVTLWRLIPRNRSTPLTRLRSIFGLGVLLVGVYLVGSSMATEGLLGAETQQRSLAQVETSGNLILGGRPELGATIALFQYRPLGFGLGALPSSTDIAVAKTGMAALNYRPNNGYVERYMFGTSFELHSTVADAWALMGVAGLLLAAVLLIVLINSFSHLLGTSEAAGIRILLFTYALWNAMFSPLYGAAPTLILALGLLLLDRRRLDEDSGPPAVPGWLSGRRFERRVPGRAGGHR